MQKDIFKKIKQAVSGRLLILKKKFNKDCFKKYALSLHSRMQSMKQGFAAAMDWLQQHLGWEACKSYGRMAAYWCRFWLGKEARQVYVWAAKNWAKKHLNKEALKGYGKAALIWIRNLPKQLTWANFKKWSIAFWHWLIGLPERLKKQRKFALLASVALLALWLYLGSATTLAWFTDVTPVARNSFVVGELKLSVEYKNDVVTEYTEMTEDSAVFNDEALYEPGYTQVVYLKIINDGDIPFDYKVKVNEADHKKGISVEGNEIYLPEYLRFGVETATTEPVLNRKVARALAEKDMTLELGTYPDLKVFDKLGVDTVKVEGEGSVHYAALIVWMPESVGNEANYRGETVPQVSLGVTVYAQQAGTPME